MIVFKCDVCASEGPSVERNIFILTTHDAQGRGVTTTKDLCKACADKVTAAVAVPLAAKPS